MISLNFSNYCQRHTGSLLFAAQWRPRAAAPSSLGPANDPQVLQKAVRTLKATAGVKWRTTPLDLTNLTLYGYSDAPLGNDVKLRTQGGCAIFLGETCRDDKGIRETVRRDSTVVPKQVKAILLYFSSRKLCRVVSSSLAAETVNLVALLDRLIALRMFLERLLQTRIRAELLTDCNSLVEHLRAETGKFSSKRLDLDMEQLREVVVTGEITCVRHCGSDLQYADTLTKLQKEQKGDKDLLEEAMESNVIKIVLM